jgi:perosamine synthetase
VLRFLPPAGTPFDSRLLATAFKSLFTAQKSACSLASFAAHVRVRHAFGVSSGRCALWVLLRTLHELLPERSVVVLPAYTCFSVPASVVRAGLKFRLVEINSENLDFDYPQLERSLGNDVLCVISSNLFGIVNDMCRLQGLARTCGAFVIDDAAQSFGAVRHGRMSGTFGDVGFYSLGRGKPLAGEGGIIVTASDQLAGAIQNELARLPVASRKDDVLLFSRLAASMLFLNPQLYWIANSLPFLKLGVTEFAPSFPVGGITHLAPAILTPLLQSTPRINQIRLRNASFLLQALKGNSMFRALRPDPDCQPSYLRLPVVAASSAVRNHVLREFHRAGIGATPFYPSAICDIEGIQRYTVGTHLHHLSAENLSQRLLTLPVHPLVQKRDLELMAEILDSSQGNKGPCRSLVTVNELQGARKAFRTSCRLVGFL